MLQFLYVRIVKIHRVNVSHIICKPRMAKPTNNDTTYDPDLYLSPDQQDLLLAALSSNNPDSSNASIMFPGRGPISRSTSAQIKHNPQAHSKPHTMSTHILSNGQYASSVPTPGSGGLGAVGLDDSPFLDFDLEDGSFDWDNSGDQLIGNIPGTSSNGDEPDLHDKRKSPGDDIDDEDGGGKRREGDDKSSKKPGRKPLTSEPTSVSPCPLSQDSIIANGVSSTEAQGTEPCCPKSIP